MAEAMAKAPPDFDLAPLRSVEPGKLVRGKDDDVGTFVLALAAAFNDMKGAYYLHEQLGELNKAPGKRPLEHAGQLSGMSDQVVRLLIGIVHEVLVLIQKHRSVLEHAEFKHVAGKLGAEDKASWCAVVATALAQDRAPEKYDATSTLLEKLRNNLAFHYGPKTIAKGYLVHFAPDSQFEHSSRAVFSNGKNMEGTRFYFVDAAMLQATHALTQVERGQVHRQFSDLAKAVANSLRALVLIFIRERAGPSTPYAEQPSLVPSPATVSTRLRGAARSSGKAKRRKR